MRDPSLSAVELEKLTPLFTLDPPSLLALLFLVLFLISDLGAAAFLEEAEEEALETGVAPLRLVLVCGPPPPAFGVLVDFCLDFCGVRVGGLGDLGFLGRSRIKEVSVSSDCMEMS